ncbi:hypothetical protein BLNAU_19916 [Blattamonas nauphoetae]|uniref:Uncharacterized protein n=1 Tax=Blattamonas nauphoetae TaxID=2049346 RepID=A0ABQ9X2M3_9EUKA|nr:hypothetical protein BLNAU_19916 [Blattamonas nauphoetae]
MLPRTILEKLLPQEIATRPVPFNPPEETLLSSCSEALETPFSVFSSAPVLFQLYRAFVNVMYQHSDLRATCLPKCIEIVELLKGKLEDKRIRPFNVFLQLYPSPDGNLDPLFDSLTLLAQLCTLSQMQTLFQFFVRLGGASLNTSFELTSYQWFSPFFLMIVDFGMLHACENDTLRVLKELTVCLCMDNEKPTIHPSKRIFVQEIVSYSEDHRDLFIALRQTAVQEEMTKMKWRMFKLTKQFRKACDLLQISSTLFSVDADCLYLTVCSLDSNDLFRRKIRDYLDAISKRNDVKLSLISSGWEDALEHHLVEKDPVVVNDISYECYLLYKTMLSFGANLYDVHQFRRRLRG